MGLNTFLKNDPTLLTPSACGRSEILAVMRRQALNSVAVFIPLEHLHITTTFPCFVWSFAQCHFYLLHPCTLRFIFGTGVRVASFHSHAPFFSAIICRMTMP